MIEPGEGHRHGVQGNAVGDGSPREGLTFMKLEWRCWEVFQSSGDGVLVVDESGIMVFANPRMSELTGYASGELLGSSVQMLVPTSSRRVHEEMLRVYRADPFPRMMGRRPFLQLRRKDGSALDVDIALAPMGAASGLRIVATIRDVTDQLGLEHERARLLDILDMVPDMVVVIDAVTLRIEYVNHAMAQTVEYAQDALIGTPISRLNPARTDAERHAILARMIAGTGHRPFSKLTLRTASGQPVPVELHDRLVTDADGSHHLVAVVRDIRSRIAREERLRASEEAFRTLFEQAPVAATVVTVSASGVGSVVLANQRAADLFGSTVADLRGADLVRFSMPEDRAADRALIADLATGRRREVSLLKRYGRRDGTALWAEMRGTRFSLPDIAGPAVLVFGLDVTERIAARTAQDREAVLASCVAEVATTALSEAPIEEVLTRIVDRARDVVGADTTALGLRTRSGTFHVPAVAGDLLLPYLNATVELTETPMVRQLRTGTTVHLPEPPAYIAEPWRSRLGPILVAPFGVDDQHPVGYLCAARAPGAPDFTPDDEEGLEELAARTQLAVHLAHARADQQRLALLEDRQRIARDLHDGALQDLIALGMELAAEAGRDTDPDRLDRDLRRLDQLEAIVRQMRQTVFQMRAPARRELGAAIYALAAEAARVLGHHPDVTTHGPLQAVPEDIAEDVIAVLREGLANVARHAHATRTYVEFEATDDAVTLTIDDDGVGAPGRAGDGYGIANIRDRAQARHGTATLVPGHDGGTRLTWSCPLTRPASS